ncbi:2OG-Fe dioxygenase family protein [Salinisphaera sp. SWV1]|uniref:2OG-Fe dioxygenase family protein n=1 Tax=Salinisphaera sp. SWV1 TaxID=3454139 RepID=UPI003F86CC90
MNMPANHVKESIERSVVSNVRDRGFIFMPGEQTESWLSSNGEQLASFRNYWHSLTLDRHMADGGTYRTRRYGEFSLRRPDSLHHLPNKAYEQPLDVNPLNGGVKRNFDPLEPGFRDHCILQNLLGSIADVVDTIEMQVCQWNIKLHPYRILSREQNAGLPTPEGLHRDGVDYIAMMLVKRLNITGGETSVTDSQHDVLWQGALSNPMDIVIADDRRTMHSVTPVTPVDSDAEAYRDVLIVAFERVDDVTAS